MLKKIGIFSLLSCVSALGFANVETLKSNLSKQYPNIQVTNIQPTAMNGLYSASLDNQIIYLDESAQHMFIGSMVRLKDQKNLTKDLVIQQNTVDWKQLPFKDAIKTVKGNGKRELAVFSDPNCPYCKKLEAELDKLNDVTIYTFIYPLKAQSVAVSQSVWCNANPAYAWKNLLQKNVQPQQKTCANPLERNLQLGRKLAVDGTPTLIFSNGFKMVGARSAAEIQTIWKELGL